MEKQPKKPAAKPAAKRQAAKETREALLEKCLRQRMELRGELEKLRQTQRACTALHLTGQQVRHPRFGQGVVTAQSAGADDYVLVSVDFNGVEKKFQAPQAFCTGFLTPADQGTARKLNSWAAINGRIARAERTLTSLSRVLEEASGPRPQSKK